MNSIKIILANVCLLLFSLSVNGQTKTISGKVQDSFESLIGVNIIIKGTTTGTATDIDGNYTIENVSESDVLVF
ncbi:MAG: hypothetical protein ACI840_000920, partial [Ulvibacter sp.]